MKKVRINISHSRFILLKLKIFGEIVTTISNRRNSLISGDMRSWQAHSQKFAMGKANSEAGNYIKRSYPRF